MAHPHKGESLTSELLMRAITWMTLKSIMLDTKGTCCLVPFTYFGEGKSLRTKNRETVPWRWGRAMAANDTGNAENDGNILFLACGGGDRTTRICPN